MPFFRKKKKTLEEYLIEVVKKPNLNFQIDIIRYNLVEIQITRQRLVIKFGIDIKSPEGLSVSLAFHHTNMQDSKRFKESTLYNDAIHLENYGEAYFFLCENSLEAISELLSSIQKNVYNYTDQTVYAYKFIKHK